MKISSKVIKKWAGDYSVWPLFASMGLAVGVVGVYGYRSLTTSPDVHFDKSGRSPTYGISANYQEGNTYYNHPLRNIKDRESGPSIVGMGWLNKTFGYASDINAHKKESK